MEQIRYPSDGLTVLAYVYRAVASSGRLPVVVFNRGSWTWDSFHAQLLVMAHRLAEAGYVVVRPCGRAGPGRGPLVPSVSVIGARP
jgi:dienelactone hydrolase